MTYTTTPSWPHLQEGIRHAPHVVLGCVARSDQLAENLHQRGHLQRNVSVTTSHNNM